MLDTASFRQMMSCFATGIAVVTAQDPECGKVGITINSLTSVSLAPPLVLFCLDKKAHLHAMLSRAEHMAINLLAEGQEDVSRHFADHRHHPEKPDMWDGTQDDCPLLAGTLGWILARRVAVYEGGDHSILLLDVSRVMKHAASRNPLLYYHSRYRKIGA